MACSFHCFRYQMYIKTMTGNKQIFPVLHSVFLTVGHNELDPARSCCWKRKHQAKTMVGNGIKKLARTNIVYDSVCNKEENWVWLGRGWGEPVWIQPYLFAFRYTADCYQQSFSDNQSSHNERNNLTWWLHVQTEKKSGSYSGFVIKPVSVSTLSRRKLLIQQTRNYHRLKWRVTFHLKHPKPKKLTIDRVF